MKAHELSLICPHCRYVCDRAGNLPGEEAPPKAGDPSFCVRCGEWAIFDDRLQLREPTDAEFVTIAFDEDCRNLRKAWADLQTSKEW